MHSLILNHLDHFYCCAEPICKTFPAMDVNVKLSVRDNNVTILQVKCLDGFNMSKGSAIRECIADDTWSGNDTVCSCMYLDLF